MPSSDPSSLVSRVATGSVRRLAIPIVLLGLIVVPSFRVLSTASYLDTWNYNLCQMKIMRSDTPASDLVVMGSSRTGASMDIPRIEESFAGTLDTAEKLVFSLGSEFDRDLAFRTYVEHRGVPKVLAIELSFERYTNRVAEQGSMFLPTTRSKTLFDPGVYADLTADLRDSGDLSLADTYVESNWISTPSFWVERLNQGFEHAVHNPRVALDPAEECIWEFEPKRGRWILGNSQPYVEEKAKIPEDKYLQRWTRTSSRFRPLDLTDPWTRQEVALLRDLVREANDVGVESVVLVYLPSFAESADVIDLDALAAAVPGATIFDARQILNDPARPTLKYQYFDVNHLNKFAAHEISVALAALAEDTAR